MTQVKICGLTEIQQASAAADAGADYLGLIFAASRRQVSPNKAAKIAGAIHPMKPQVPVVGIFVNSPVQEVNRLADFCNLNWIQLSGIESWEYCLEIKRPIIKAVHVSADCSSEEILEYMEEGYRLISKNRLMYSLDTHIDGAFGGTGQTFNWQLAKEVAAVYPVIIAGGLNPDNVGKLIKEVHPWGVDVSSGVETTGKKDIEKIKEFIKRVKQESPPFAKGN